MKTKQEIQAIVDNLDAGEYYFSLKEKGDGYLLQVWFHGLDVDEPEKGKMLLTGRKWYVSPHATESEIVETAFAAVQRTILHELAETFTYKGRRVFSPHFDVNARIHMVDEKRYDVRG